MTNPEILKGKLKASGLRLLLSGVIFAILFYIIRYQWYPNVLFALEGGLQGIKLIAGVDLVLGPLMTLVIFNHTKSKKEIAFDLSLIACIQIGALTLGIYSTHSMRPLAVAYHDGYFISLIAEDLKEQNTTITQLKNEIGPFPQLVYAKTPQTDDEKAGAVAFSTMTGLTPHHLTFLYTDIKNHIQDILKEHPNGRVPLKGFYGDGHIRLSEKGQWLSSKSTQN